MRHNNYCEYLTLLEQKDSPASQYPIKIGHYKNFCRYPFFKKSGGKRRLSGKKKDMAFLEIKKLIDSGVTSTKELASCTGRSQRQVRRYIINMAMVRIIKLDSKTSRLVKKRKPKSFLDNNFTEVPEISKWIDDCIAREVKPRTISQYVNCVRHVFRSIRAKPGDVVSSKKSAIEFWTKFIVDFRKKNPEKGSHGYRTSFKNFLSSHYIVFPPRMGKIYGLSSAHDNYGSHAGVAFSPQITETIGKTMLEANDFRTYVWWRIGLRTGARNKAIAKMVWERIYFNEKDEDGSESFKLEQHETKDPRGQWFLGENGEWKVKYPPPEIKEILLEWKARSENSKFLWFKDSLSDIQNRRNSRRAARITVTRLKSYYTRIADMVDPHTREYMFKRPAHMMRHTLAQQMRNGGLTNEEIAEMFGWRTSSIVGIWYTKISEKKRKKLGKRCSTVKF